MTSKPALTNPAKGLVVAGLVTVLIVLGAGCSRQITANGTLIDGALLKAEVARRLAVMKKKSPADLAGKRGGRLAEKTRRQVAGEMVKEMLIEEQAAKLSLKLPPDEVNRRLEADKARRGADQFAKDLARQKMTEEEYKQKLHQQALTDALAAKVTADARVSDDEAETFYLTHPDLFSRSQMVRMLQIFVDTEGQAKMVLDQLKAGQDFATLAASVSQDATTRLNGGDMGWVERGTMDPAFEENAFAVPTGQISDIIKASDGYHIVKVIDRREAYKPPFSEVKARAFEDALNDKKDEMFSDWLRTIYANAVVKVPGALGAWDPALGMIVVKYGGGH